ncbi:hypothetical protein AB832_03155 [Flavobacteriaceae bacterium (ex Bugula neritina AB1)]|nr:hypothetical protein AB832_03155 [Flavobacteriaceae bacterium (ex Bugula neritina AB1)]
MKKYIFKILLITSVLFLGSCDVADFPTFDVNGGQTLVAFNITATNLDVIIDDTGTTDIQLNVSTVSSSDRTYSVTINEELTTELNTDNYNFNPTITVPAGEYNGILTINGIDNSVDTTGKLLVLDLVESNEFLTGSNSQVTINIRQVCPVPTDKFVGNYLIEQTTPFAGGGPSLANGTVITVEIPDVNTSPNGRSFMTSNFPNYCSTPIPFTFELICNNVIVDTQDTNCACSSRTDYFAPATTPSTYDVSDDNIFFVTFTEDAQSDCSSPLQTTYRFTKQ